MQSPLQLAVQLASACRLHIPSHSTLKSAAQAASRCTGVHWALHSASGTYSHLASAEMYMLPQALKSCADACVPKIPTLRALAPIRIQACLARIADSSI